MRLLLLTLTCLAALPCATAGAIVGGRPAPAGVYDAVANVAISGSGSCGGTLVAPSWVLSAGHCGSITGGLLGTPIGWPPGAVTVTLGTTARDGSGGRRHTVDEVRLSPSYLATNGNDVSLLRLATPATQAPIPIAGAPELWKPGVLGTIAGFGVTRDGGEAPPVMHIAEVPIQPDTTCLAAYPSSFESRTQLCAGYPQGGVDTCQGDSGGPLLVRDGAGALRVAGVTSYGDGCARAGRYGIYARVAGDTLREWVRRHVPEAIASGGATAPPPPPGTTPPPPPPPATGRLRLVSLRAAAKGARLTLVVPARGRLVLRWKAGAKRGTRALTLRGGRRTLLLGVPRRARRVFVTATLTPSAGGSVAAARRVLRVSRRTR